MAERLKREYYGQPATILAQDLIGKLLCRETQEGVLKCRITETECYYGEEDTACHASKGKTDRTKILYERGGLAYGIDRGLIGEDLVVSSRLWIEDDGFRPKVRTDKRVGIDYATPKYRDILWRYLIDDGQYRPAK